MSGPRREESGGGVSITRGLTGLLDIESAVSIHVGDPDIPAQRNRSQSDAQS